MKALGCCRVQPTNSVRYFLTAPASRLFERSNALLDRESDEIREVANAEFLHHSRAVGLHGLRRKGERSRDFGDGVSFGKHLQDLPLAGAEPLKGFVRGSLV